MTALIIIGTAIVCMAPSVLLFLALHGAAIREQRIENAFRIRDLLEDARRNRPYGDWPAMPSDLKVCHKGTIRHERD